MRLEAWARRQRFRRAFGDAQMTRIRDGASRKWKVDRMITARQFILVVVVSLLIAAVVLFPRREEHAAMLAGEGRHKEAIAILERRLAGAPPDPDLLAALGRSYAAVGEVPQAIDAFDGYLAVRPDDLAAREREAELLLQSGLTDRYLGALARVAAAQPSPARVTRLIELYRLHGRVEDEISTLQAYAGKGILDVPQLERLGALLAERGDWRDARQWLELADQEAPPDASAGRLLLLEVLIQSNEVDQIVQRAQIWMGAWRSPFLSGKLILRMAQSGHAVPASRLALKYTDLMPDDALDMVGLFVSKGRQDIARQMLVRWAGRTSKMAGTQLHAFVQASALIGDVSVALGKFLQLVQSGSDAATEGQLAEELGNAFGRPALITIRPLLSNAVLLTRPLFAAELSLREGNREMARWYLNRIDPVQLPLERLTAWLALVHRVETDAEVLRRLAILWNDGRLPAELVPRLADEAAKFGQVKTNDLIWNSVRQ
jgi:tetratricopeptide (TPR) repeat protein